MLRSNPYYNNLILFARGAIDETIVMLHFIYSFILWLCSFFINVSPWVFIVWLGITPYSHGIGTQEVSETGVCTWVIFWSEAHIGLWFNIHIFNTLGMVVDVSFKWWWDSIVVYRLRWVGLWLHFLHLVWFL